MSAGEFVSQNPRAANCADGPVVGNKSVRYDYIQKAVVDDYPPDACVPWYHGNFQVDNIELNTSLIGSGSINIGGSILAGGNIVSNGGAHVLSAKKNFDIPHPNKPGWRLRHTCLEGPSNDVYFRGRLTEKNVIELPEYWKNFVNPESITITLTQIGSSQDLIIDKVEWGNRVVIRSGSASRIDCYYLIHGTRMDGEDLIVEYEGESPADYPGDNSQYSVSGYHYDNKEEQK